MAFAVCLKTYQGAETSEQLTIAEDSNWSGKKKRINQRAQ